MANTELKVILRTGSIGIFKSLYIFSSFGWRSDEEVTDVRSL